MADNENIIEDLDTLLEQGDDSKNLWPNIKGHGIDWRMPNRKDYEFGRDAARFFWSTGQEGLGLLKSFYDRGGGFRGEFLNPIGIYNFYQDTFGKGEKGKKITIPWEDVQNDPRLYEYVSDWWSRTHPQSLQTLPEEDRNLLNDYHLSNQELEDEINLLLDKNGFEDEYVNEAFSGPTEDWNKFLRNLSEEEGQILNGLLADKNKRKKTLNDQGIGLSPFERHDYDGDGHPEAITIDTDFQTEVPMEPNIKAIGNRPYNEGYTDVMSFPYLGEYGFNEDDKFEMIRPSATKPFDAPGFTALSEKIPPFKAVDVVQDWIAPEYSADPELYHSPGFQTAMGLTGAKLAQSALPYVSKLSRFAKANPYIAGIATALTAHKANAPGIVPEGVEVTPENIERYGQIAKEKGLLGWEINE